jgi:hypothetical protein
MAAAAGAAGGAAPIGVTAFMASRAPLASLAHSRPPPLRSAQRPIVHDRPRVSENHRYNRVSRVAFSLRVRRRPPISKFPAWVWKWRVGP